jgi:ABC-2 type transport system permease protein
MFPFLYITTSQAPKDLLPPAMRIMASYNPITYILEGVRALVLSSWSNPAIWQGFLVALGMFIVMVGVALNSFKKALK